jgi:hypothetical protein
VVVFSWISTIQRGPRTGDGLGAQLLAGGESDENHTGVPLQYRV